MLVIVALIAALDKIASALIEALGEVVAALIGSVKLWRTAQVAGSSP